MSKLRVMSIDKTYEVEDGKTLLSVLSDYGYNLDSACGGRGTCGKCKVKIKKGCDETEVLACEYKVEDDLTVWLGEQTDSTKVKTMISLPNSFVPDESVKSLCLKSEKKLGVAVDIGTTTIVVMLWDIMKTELLGVKAITNPQGEFGADVISRITFANQGAEKLTILQRKVIDCINKKVKELLDETKSELSRIGKFSVVGNTTMSHLFMGIDPRSLAVLPFEPVFTQGKRIGAQAIGLKPDDAQVNLLPNIAGHIGSDITAGLMTCDVIQEGESKLYIDIGTNGEIVLCSNGRIYACSTAAGPAFEGNNISMGMRARKGAIEGVEISQGQIKLETIENAQPIGICGSGIIDVAYELTRNGIVNKNGRLLSQSELEDKGIEHSIASCSKGEGNKRYFELCEEGIYVNQNDIREIQLAKGAIATGISLLLKRAGIGEKELDELYIAGAFGSYINLKKAIGIGLIPDIPMEKIKSIGNAAGIGAAMGLFSDEILEGAEKLRSQIEHIELSLEPSFLEIYSKNMKFK